MAEPKDLEAARRDPSSVFERPADVLDRDDWTREQKIEVLRRWEYDAAEETVAEEEGMTGTRSSPMIGEVLEALDRLGEAVDPERAAAHKQHGL